MPSPISPSPDRSARERARQKTILKATIVILVLGGVAMLGLARLLPLPLRIFLAGTDLIVAAVLWLVYYQKFGRGRSA